MESRSERAAWGEQFVIADVPRRVRATHRLVSAVAQRAVNALPLFGGPPDAQMDLEDAMEREWYCDECGTVVGVMTRAAFEALGRLCDHCNAEPADERGTESAA